MFKLITHAAVFLIGAGAGVYCGVHYPVQAANVSDIETAKIQQAVAAAKQQVVAEQSNNPGQPVSALQSKYQQMLQSAQQDLDAAKAKVNGQ